MLDLLLGVTIFSYFLIHIKHPLLKKNSYKWLYTPFLVSIILELSISFSEYFFNLHNSSVDFLVMYIKDIMSIVFNLFLIFYARKLILNANNIIEDKRRWLLKFNTFIICIITSFALAWIEEYLFNSIYIYSILWILVGLLFWWVLYYGVFRLQIIVQKEEIHEYLVSKKVVSVPVKKKKNKTNTSKIITQLYKLMEDEEIYKNPLLSRLDLATKLDASEGYLSQVINQELNKSVTQFVNGYRIEAAKNLLHNPVFNKYSVEAIGLEVGFKSKSAFYNVFKNNLKMSPGAFRKLQKSPNS